MINFNNIFIIYISFINYFKGIWDWAKSQIPIIKSENMQK